MRVDQASLFPANLPVKTIERPPVSLSMAGHCRMELWLAGHGFARGATEPKTQRIFDVGNLIEAALFDAIRVWDPQTQGVSTIGPWWPALGELVDPATGEYIDTTGAEFNDRQREVKVAGVVGHIDGITRLFGKFLLVDAKTMGAWNFKEAAKQDLLEDVFKKEYVAQMVMYIKGLRLQGLEVDRGFLLCYNRDNMDFMVRMVEYDEAVVADSTERLSWAQSDKMPTPDWAWSKGAALPLRCQYCDFRQHCAAVRGETIRKDGKKWEVA